MMHLEIGPGPFDEDCASIGLTPRYERLARIECELYIALLIAHYGPPPRGAHYNVTPNDHDFGTYYEVSIAFDANYPEAVDYAHRAEQGRGSWSPFKAPVDYPTARTPIVQQVSANSAIVASLIAMRDPVPEEIARQRERLRFGYPYAAAAADVVLASLAEAAPCAS